MILEQRRPPQGPPDLYSFLFRAVSALRWGTLALLLLLTLLEPGLGRTGIPNWALLIAFAVYNLLSEALLSRLPGLNLLAWRSAIDLIAAELVYFLGVGPEAPLFVLLFLAVVCAAVILSLRGSLVYTLAAMLLTAGIETTFNSWQADAHSFRELGSRAAVLLLAGIGTAILSRRLAIEQEQASSAQYQAQRLAEQDRQRGEFVSSVSHNLRTPFTAARAGLGMLETSLDGRLRPAESDLFANVGRSLEQLGIVINDLLSFNQLEAGALRLQRQTFDLRQSVADAIMVAHPLFAGKSQPLEVDVPDPLPVRGDERRLAQVVINLLDNAHRYTPPGTRVQVTGRVQGGETLLSVVDEGPGIPEDQCALIFNRFHRYALLEGGSGLGLANAKAIVELHGGRIWVESKLGKGSSFFVALPEAQDYEEVEKRDAEAIDRR